MGGPGGPEGGAPAHRTWETKPEDEEGCGGGGRTVLGSRERGFAGRAASLPTALLPQPGSCQPTLPVCPSAVSFSSVSRGSTPLSITHTRAPCCCTLTLELTAVWREEHTARSGLPTSTTEAHSQSRRSGHWPGPSPRSLLPQPLSTLGWPQGAPQEKAGRPHMWGSLASSHQEVGAL